MKDLSRRQYIQWIFILCILVCAVIDAYGLPYNKHEKEHSRKLELDTTTNDETHPKEHNKEVNPIDEKASIADKQMIYDINNDIVRQFNTNIQPNEHYRIEHLNFKDANNHINDINTKDIATGYLNNYNRNHEELNPKLGGMNSYTIYLGGYDDQIFNLMNDIRKQSGGSEILIYFYLYTNYSFRNIGFLHTDKNTLENCIRKYTHYFCVGHNKKDCSCLTNIIKDNSTEKPIVQIVQSKSENNKIDYTGSIPGNNINTKPEINKFSYVGNTISEPKVYYPEKQSSGSYELILPNEMYSKSKDIYVDLLKSKQQEVLGKSKVVQDMPHINNVAEQAEITNNILSGDNVAATVRLDQQNIDSTTEKTDHIHILTDSLNTDILSNKSDYKIYYPKKQSSGSYEVIIPNEKYSKSTDIYVDLLKSEPQNVLGESKGMHHINNNADQVEITNNILSSDNVASAVARLDQQNIDSTTEKTDHIHILTDSLNTDIFNNKSDYKVYYPEKQSSGSYEVIIPNEKNSKSTDIYVDLLKSEPQEVSSESKVVQGMHDMNNNVEQVEITNNILSGDNFESTVVRLDQQNVDSTTEKSDHVHILTDSLNTDILSNKSDYKIYYPEKQSSGSYEVIIPNKKYNKSTDIYVDLLKSEPQEVSSESKVVQSMYDMGNNVEQQVEITNNLLSGNNVTFDDHEKPDHIHILSDSLNTDILNNEGYYLNGMIDQETNQTPSLVYNLPNINLSDSESSSVLQLEPTSYKEQEHNHVFIIDPNMQLMDGGNNIKSDVEITPNVENFEPQNVIVQKTTTFPINVVTEIRDQTKEPKNANDEYLTYSQTIPDKTDANVNILNQAVDNENASSFSLLPSQINRVMELNANLDHPNIINDAVNTKLTDGNIILNPVPNNIIEKIPEIINIGDKVALKTNDFDEISEDQGNFITIHNNLNQNLNTNTDIEATPSTPTSKILDTVQVILTPDTKLAQTTPDIEPTITVESETINNKENEFSSYVDYSNPHLHESNMPAIVTEEDNAIVEEDKASQLSTKGNVKAQLPCNNAIVNSNHYNIPILSTNVKEVPQSHIHHYNYGYHVNRPSYSATFTEEGNSNKESQLSAKGNVKPQSPYNNIDAFADSNQYNIPILSTNYKKVPQSHIHSYNYGDHVTPPYEYINYKQIDNEQHPPTSGGIHDLYGNGQYDYILRKPNFIQNKNLYTLDPLKYMLSPNILQPILSKQKNIVTYLEPLENKKADSISDLFQVSLVDEHKTQSIPEQIIPQFEEDRSQNIMANWKNYEIDKTQIVTDIPDKGTKDTVNYMAYNKKPISLYKYNTISSPTTFLPYQPYSGKKFNGYEPNFGSNACYMLDPCAYKNILTLEGYNKPTVEISNTPATSKELTDKGDTLLDNSQYINGGFAPTNYNLHIPTNIPLKPNINALPMNQYYTYLSNLSKTKKNLTPITSIVDLSHRDQYDISSASTKPIVSSQYTHPIVEKVPTYGTYRDVSRIVENITPSINVIYDITNKVLQKGSLIEPTTKYINNKPKIPESSKPMTAETIPLGKLGLNDLQTLYQAYLCNYNPLQTSFNSLPSKSKPLVYLKDLTQQNQMSNIITPYEYSTVAPKIKPWAQDLIVAGLPNNIDSIPTNINNALLQHVSPTVLNPCYQKIDSLLPKFISPTITDSTYYTSFSFPVTPMTSYYPFASVSVNPLQIKTTVSQGNLLTNSLFSPYTADSPVNTSMPFQLTSRFFERIPYTSETTYMPNSNSMWYLFPSKEKPSTTEHLADFEPLTSRAITSENILGPPSVLPLSTLIHDKHIYTPFLGGTASYIHIPSLKASLPSKKFNTVPSYMKEGKYIYEPIPHYSESITPTQAFKAPSNYVTLPQTMTLNYYPRNTDFNKASPQKTFNEVPSTPIYSAPGLSVFTPFTKIDDMKSSTKTLNLLSNVLPDNAKVSSIAQPQNRILFVPNSRTTEPVSFYRPQYSTFTNALTKPITTNIFTSKNFMLPTHFPTLTSIEEPIDFKLIHFPYLSNPKSFAIPETFSVQALDKYLPPIEKFENILPILSTSSKYKASSTYPTTDLKPLILSPNYLMVSKLADDNKSPWIPLNYNIRPTTQLETLSVPSFTKPVKEKDESVPLIVSGTSSLPLPDVITGNLNPVLSTQASIAYSNPMPLKPYKFSENTATLMPSNTILPYSYSPGTNGCITWKNVWNPPYKVQSRKPYLQMNDVINNVANLYQIPSVKPMLWSQEVPSKYGENYELPVQVTSETYYGLPKQASSTSEIPTYAYNEPTPLYAVPKLALQSTIPTISKLGLQRPANRSLNSLPNEIKPSQSNNAWPSSFLRYKVPKLAPNNVLIKDPFKYIQSGVVTTPASLNEMTYPFTTSNPILPLPGFQTSSISDSSKYKFREPIRGSEFVPDKCAKIAYSQVVPSESSRSVLPFNLNAASIPFVITPKPVDNLQMGILPSGNSHVSYPLHFPPNKFNNIWTSLLPYSKIISIKNPETVFNFVSTNLQNVTPISPDYNSITNKPVLGATLSVSDASNIPNFTPQFTLATDPSVSKSTPRPILQTQYLSSYFSNLPSKIYFTSETSKRPLDHFSTVSQTYPPVFTNANINMNEPNLSFSNLQDQQTISPLFNLKNSKSSPVTIKWANLGGNRKFTPISVSVNPIYINSDSIAQKITAHSLPTSSFASSPTTVPWTPQTYSSESLTSTYYSPYAKSIGKTSKPCIKTPDFVSYTYPAMSPKYISSIPYTHILTLDETQLKSNDILALLSPTFSPYSYRTFPTESKIDSKLHVKPLSNKYYQSATPLTYGNVYQNNHITTPTIVKNLPYEAYSVNQPYSKTLQKATVETIEQPNVNIINEINNNLNKYITQLDLLPNLLSKDLIVIPLNNIGVVKYEPAKYGKISYLKTDNPDIYLKVWPTAVKIVKAKIVLEMDRLDALNFSPIVYYKNTQYTNEDILKIVEGFVKMYYGEPIIVKTVHNNHVVVDNINESVIKNGKVYIVWANVCDCGCNRIGYQCRYN